MTHLVEIGYPERFVTEQVGHTSASTTAIYTSVSDDFKNQALRQAMARLYPDKRDDNEQREAPDGEEQGQWAGT